MGWYIYRKGGIYGPYTREQLLDMSRQGELSPDDLFCPEHSKEWIPVEDVPILRETTPVQAEPPGETRAASPAGDSTSSPAAASSGAGRKKKRPALKTLLWVLLPVLLVLFFMVFWNTLTDREEVILKQQVFPSAEDQVISVKGEVSVTIPGGMLEEPEKLRITRLSWRADIANGFLESEEVYRITLGDLGEFSEPLTLEFSFDPELQAEAEAGELYPAFLNEDTGDWVLMDAEVDPERHRLIIHTDHLSIWSYFRSIFRRTDKEELPDFSVYQYDEETDDYIFDEDRSLPGIEVTYVAADQPSIGGQTMDQKEFAGMVALLMREAYKNYQAMNYTLPDLEEGKPIRVILCSTKGEDEGAWGEWRKFIYLGTTYSSEAELKGTIAHELFHAVQNEHLSVARMYENHWLIEATAEYAGYRECWDPPLQLDRSTYKIAPNISMRTTDKRHEYAAAHFIDYLVMQKGLNFKDMWDTITKTPTITTNLNSFLMERTGSTMASNYRDFLHYVLTAKEAYCKDFNVENSILYFDTDSGYPERVHWEQNEEGLHYAEKTLTVSERNSMAGFFTHNFPETDNPEISLMVEVVGGFPSTIFLAAFPTNIVSAVPGVVPIPGGREPAATLYSGDEQIDVKGRERAFFEISPGEGVLITAFGYGAGSVTVRIIETPGGMALDMINPYSSEGQVMETRVDERGRRVVQDVALWSTYGLQVTTAAFPEGVERIRLEWDFSETVLEPAFGDFRREIELDPVQDDMPPLTFYRFTRAGHNRVGAALYDITDPLRERELYSEALDFYLTHIASSTEAETGREIGRWPRTAARPGETIVFDGLPREGDFRYRWDFGDGTEITGTDARVTHTYSEPGRYLVSLELLTPLRMTDPEDEVLARTHGRRVILVEGEVEEEADIDVPVEEFIPGVWRAEVIVEEGDREYWEHLLRTHGMDSEQFLGGPFLGETLEKGLMLLPEDLYREMINIFGIEKMRFEIRYDLPHLYYKVKGEARYSDLIAEEIYELTIYPGGQSFSGTYTLTIDGKFVASGPVTGELVEPFTEEQLGEMWEALER